MVVEENLYFINQVNMSAIQKGPKIKRYSFLQTDSCAVSKQIRQQYDTKWKYQVTIPLMLRIRCLYLNKRLAVERMWSMYCYDQTKLNYEMSAMEF